jgi:uncharacterized membrane protein
VTETAPAGRRRLDVILARVRRPLLYVMSAGYVVAGVLHFLAPAAYVQIVPPVLPAPLVLVYLSGLAEVAVGIGLLYPPTRQLAAWGTILLLLAVFPANVYMATSGVAVESAAVDADPSAVVRWLRLPLQGVLVGWAWWYTRPMPEADG